MNYYEHHIGDYDAATAHLSMLEDAAYSRLLRLYYRKEAPIPADVATVCRLIRATSKDERRAVETVLQEFFTLADDGWHQRRCDADIGRYQAKAEKNREVGKLGGRPRKTETMTVPENNHGGFFSKPKQNPPQTPDTRHQTPNPSNQIPDRSDPPCQPDREILRSGSREDSVVAIAPTARRGRAEGPTTAVWEAYSAAYEGRYGTPPVRNASVNGQLANLVQRIGTDDAPHVAAWFVGHNAAWYVTKGHAVSALLADCEKLRTEWATNRRITTTAARQADRTQAGGEVWAKLIREREEEIQHGQL